MRAQGSRDELSSTATELARYTYRPDGDRRRFGHDRHISGFADAAPTRGAARRLPGFGER